MKLFNIFNLKNLKTGRSPCEKKMFDFTCLTGTQKLQLAQMRIFQNTVGDGFKSCKRKVRKIRTTSFLEEKMEIMDMDDFFPYRDKEQSTNEYDLAKFERRRHKILMRGVKLGAKKASSGDNMGIFAQKK